MIARLGGGRMGKVQRGTLQCLRACRWSGVVFERMDDDARESGPDFYNLFQTTDWTFLSNAGLRAGNIYFHSYGIVSGVVVSTRFAPFCRSKLSQFQRETQH